MQSLSMVRTGSSSQPRERAGDPLRLSFERKPYCFAESGFVPYGKNRTTPGDKIRFAMCHASPRSDVYDVLNERLLAGPYDHIEAAILVITCVGHGKCETRGPRAVYESDCISGHCTYSPSKTADFAFYAERTTVDDVRRAVMSAEVPADVKTAFITRYEACRNHILQAVAALDSRRKAIYVDAIAAARKQRHDDDTVAAPFAVAADTLKRIADEALLEHRGTSTHLDRALTLRAQFINACMKSGRSVVHCLSGQVSRPLTKLIVRLAVANDKLQLAAAENEVLMLAPSHEDPAVDIHLAVRAAMYAENERWAAWSEAKSKDIDPSVLARKFGTPLNLADEANEAGYSPPGVLEFSSDIEAAAKRANVSLAEIARAIKRVDRKGKLTTISFVDIVTKSEEQVGCRETNKPDRVTASGDVIYREDCSNAKWLTVVHRDHVDPIVVSVDESARLTPNAYVKAIVDEKTRKGHVVTVFASKQQATTDSPLQIRSFVSR